MAKHLQIEFDISTPVPGLSEIKLTPFDFAIPEAAAVAIQEAIALGDKSDAIPGDGQLEEKADPSIPVKFNWSFIHLNETITVPVEGILRVVDKP